MKFLRLFPAVLSFAVISSSVALAADVSVTASSVVASSAAKVITGIAGGTITAGQPVYRDTTTGRYSAADANAATPIYKVAGIAITGAAVGQQVRVCTKDPVFTPGFTTAAGSVYIASATAGGIAPVADAATGHYVTVLGVGLSTTTMNLNITRSDVAKP